MTAKCYELQILQLLALVHTGSYYKGLLHAAGKFAPFAMFKTSNCQSTLKKDSAFKNKAYLEQHVDLLI